MSASCSMKLRIFILVVNTANMVNERITPNLGITHALTAPTALFTTYIFIGIFVLGSFYKQYASWFLQIYALITCCIIEISLSFIIFKELKANSMGKQNAAAVLNGVLPMINAVLLLIDLAGLVLSNSDASDPASIPTNVITSQSQIQ